MSTVQEQNAIRNRIYIAGKSFTRDPSPITMLPKRTEQKTPTSNIGLRVDRPFIAAGFPNVTTRYELTFAWPTIVEPTPATTPGLMEWLGIISAMGQPFDVAIWKQVYDVFDGDGVTQTFYLPRRQATAYNLPMGVPATDFADYETRLTYYSTSLGTVPVPTGTDQVITHKNSSNIDTGNPGAGDFWTEDDGELQGKRLVTRMRVGTAPAAASDIMVAAYVPLFRMVVDQEAARSYAKALTEPRSIKLVEV